MKVEIETLRLEGATRGWYTRGKGHTGLLKSADFQSPASQFTLLMIFLPLRSAINMLPYNLHIVYSNDIIGLLVLKKIKQNEMRKNIKKKICILPYLL